jgi:hypothetical protein
MRRTDIKPLPSCEELHRLFAYDPTTGKLTWRLKPHQKAQRIQPGDDVGTVKKGRGNYLSIGIGRKYYLAHRIIWKMTTGDDPADQIDHVDGDRLNNRWNNLRPASNGQNKWNSSLSRNNKSGVKGVCWDAGHKKWKAYISIGGKQSRLGRFASIDEAAVAVNAARTKLHGEFARAN